MKLRIGTSKSVLAVVHGSFIHRFFETVHINVCPYAVNLKATMIVCCMFVQP